MYCYLFDIDYSTVNYRLGYYCYLENYYSAESCYPIEYCHSLQYYSAAGCCPMAVYCPAYYPVFRFLYHYYTDIHYPVHGYSELYFLLCCYPSASCFPTYSPSCSDSTTVLPAIASYCFLHFPHQCQILPSAWQRLLQSDTNTKILMLSLKNIYDFSSILIISVFHNSRFLLSVLSNIASFDSYSLHSV